ncbi:hypothetical protein [Salinigranum salinum]|uniref:hypothetical protein n=1 Tax=Salinigranum salinum TaxID=1364937 RepID=UPI001260BC83|nr:hypothetical protein [Salinigranum salinum]
MGDETLRCRRCGAELRTGLVASGRRACCLNATPIVGSCPTHGPLGPHHATRATDGERASSSETDGTSDPEPGERPDDGG